MLGRRLARVHRSPLSTRSTGNRETFIALRACRKALEIARGMRFSKPIDIVHIYCQSCGAEVDASRCTDDGPIRCASCAENVRLPGYLRRSVRKLDEEEESRLRRYEHILHVVEEVKSRHSADVVMGVVVTILCVMATLLAVVVIDLSQ